MAMVVPDPAGITRLVEQLDAGAPFVVPLPSPLPSVVIGTDAPAVNTAKGRPREQPVGVGTTSVAPIMPAMLLDPDTVDLVRWLCHDEGVGVPVPVSSSAPWWLSPATVDGLAFLGSVWLGELAELLAGRTHVYMSSGNATGSQPAVTAAQTEARLWPGAARCRRGRPARSAS